MNEALAAFVAALLWAASTAVRSEGATSVLQLLALFGCGSVVLVPAALVARRARPLDTGARGLLYGVALAGLPLLFFGALLFTKTHHRALGGVTFAFIAAGAVVAGALVARGVRGVARWGRAPHVVLALLGGASLVYLLVSLFGASRGAAAIRGPVVEAVLGMALLASASVVPVDRLPAWTRAASFAACVAAVSGVVLFALNQDLRRHLAEAAPIATFVARVILL